VRLLLATLALLLALTSSAAADYWLDAKLTQHNGNRWYLMKFGTVKLEAGEIERVWLNLSTCPGGVDNIMTYYVEPLPEDRGKPFGYQPGWGYGTEYNGYPLAISVIVGNYSESDMTFAMKLQIRCDE
jgi:hypothetical protein